MSDLRTDLPDVHLDAIEFARLVESAQILLRKGHDDNGLLLIADAKPIDIAEALRTALSKVVAERFRVTVDDWDKITSRAIVGPDCDPLLGLLADRWYSHQNAVRNV